MSWPVPRNGWKPRFVSTASWDRHCLLPVDTWWTRTPRSRLWISGGETLLCCVRKWKRKKAEDPLLILQEAADSAGVQLEIQGQLPEEPEYRQFFLVAASEGLTNAVFHAGAKTLRIELTEAESQWAMRFCNDGAKPEKPITEGGGLGSLRRKAESIGAAMIVESDPEFALTITGRKG